jgi:hypothetical protein
MDHGSWIMVLPGVGERNTEDTALEERGYTSAKVSIFIAHGRLNK